MPVVTDTVFHSYGFAFQMQKVVKREDDDFRRNLPGKYSLGATGPFETFRSHSFAHFDNHVNYLNCTRIHNFKKVVTSSRGAEASYIAKLVNIDTIFFASTLFRKLFNISKNINGINLCIIANFM